jgi:hypothetical protein
MKKPHTLTPDEIRRHFPHATQSTLKANGGEDRPGPGAPTRAARRTLKAILTAGAVPVPPKPQIEKKGPFGQFVPVPIYSEANTREHWRTKAARVASQRGSVAYFLSELNGRPKPVWILLARYSARTLDSDNLATAFKHVRDEIAALLKFDDRDPSVEWRYEQAKDTTRNGFTVDIEFPPPVCPHCGQPLPEEGLTIKKLLEARRLLDSVQNQPIPG